MKSPPKWNPTFLLLVSFVPSVAAWLVIQLSEPFPHGWLDPSNPQIWPNRLRAFAFLLGGAILALVAYVMLRSVRAEDTVSGGHPRRKLYQHISLISLGHGLLMMTLLFYIRDRINDSLSPGTPFALSGMLFTIVALQRLLSYQNSRLHRYHSAKQVIGTIRNRDPSDDGFLVVQPHGSLEPIGLHEWLDGYNRGEIVRMTVEKVEEYPEVERRALWRWLARSAE